MNINVYTGQYDYFLKKENKKHMYDLYFAI